MLLENIEAAREYTCCSRIYMLLENIHAAREYRWFKRADSELVCCSEKVPLLSERADLLRERWTLLSLPVIACHCLSLSVAGCSRCYAAPQRFGSR
jgi:hypothetical protein